MSYEAGVWSVDSCALPDFSKCYPYIITRKVGEDLVDEFTLNSFAPLSGESGVSANAWLTADTCEDARPEVHARTSAQEL